MAELSAKEYWLLKEIEKEFREYVHPRHLFYYILDNLQWREMKELTWVDIKYLIEFDNFVKKTQMKRQLFSTIEKS